MLLGHSLGGTAALQMISGEQYYCLYAGIASLSDAQTAIKSSDWTQLCFLAIPWVAQQHRKWHQAGNVTTFMLALRCHQMLRMPSNMSI